MFSVFGSQNTWFYTSLGCSCALIYPLNTIISQVCIIDLLFSLYIITSSSYTLNLRCLCVYVCVYNIYVFYRCCKNYCKRIGFERQPLISSQFPWVRIWGLTWFLYSGSRQTEIKGLAGCVPVWRLWGKIPLRFLWIVGRIQILVVVGLKSPFLAGYELGAALSS